MGRTCASGNERNLEYYFTNSFARSLIPPRAHCSPHLIMSLIYRLRIHLAHLLTGICSPKMTSRSIQENPFEPGHRSTSRTWFALVHWTSYIEDSRQSFVRSITIYKEKQGATHEFLVIEAVIVTASTPPTTIYLKVERMGSNGRTPSQSSTSLQSVADVSALSSSTNPAFDTVYVSANEFVEQASSWKGETAVFEHERFVLTHLACLLRSISEYHPTYHLIAKNCFWYVKCTFQLAQAEYHGRVIPGASDAKLGYFKDIPIVPDTLKTDKAMFAKITEEWNKWKDETCDLKSSQEVRRVLHS